MTFLWQQRLIFLYDEMLRKKAAYDKKKKNVTFLNLYLLVSYTPFAFFNLACFYL